MRAAWYEHRGPAAETLVVGEMPDVEPGAGEVRIKIEVSGLSPADVKKRAGWRGSPMPYPRVIPHSDGAGTTAGEYVVVPNALAVALPHGADAAEDRVLAEQAACLGIAGITGYRAVFADGPVRGLHVPVHGATGGVGWIALQMALRDGATVIAGVRDGQQARTGVGCQARDPHRRG